MRALTVAFVFVGVMVSRPSPTHAGGFDYSLATSTRGAGRGDAARVRADDPLTAASENPAGLATIAGTQWMGDARAYYETYCFDRFGTYHSSWGTAADGTAIPYAAVCTAPKKRSLVVPGGALSWRWGKRAAIAIGLQPPATTRFQKFGTERRSVALTDTILDFIDDVAPGYRDEVEAAIGSTPPLSMGGFVPAPAGTNVTAHDALGNPLLPSPSQWMLTDRDAILAYAIGSIGIRVTDRLDIGGSLGWGVAFAKVTSYLRLALDDSLAAQFAGFSDLPLDGEVNVRGFDGFVPRIAGSLRYRLSDSIDVAAGGRWEDALRSHGTTQIGTLASFDATTFAPIPVKGRSYLKVPRPMQFWFGLRYASRRAPRRAEFDRSLDRITGRVDDEMTRENWDVELNVVYDVSSMNDAYTIALADVTNVYGDTNPLVPVAVPSVVVKIPHGWRDQASFRLGGDLNILPGKLTLRGGVSYETSGFGRGSGFGFPDFLPLQRLGVHGGLSLRVKGRTELSAALAYFKGFTHRVEVGDGRVYQMIADLQGDSAQGPAVNEGTYSSTTAFALVSARIFFR